MATTTGTQQGDAALHQTVDGGEINIVDGIMEMCPGLEVAAYISLFGGNESDDGSDSSPLQYWGNLIETDESRIIRSRTQHLLRSLPITSGNVLRIEEAVQSDLAWLLTDKVASGIDVTVSIPGVDKVQIDIMIEAAGEESEFTFTDNWKASI